MKRLLTNWFYCLLGKEKLKRKPENEFQKINCRLLNFTLMAVANWEKITTERKTERTDNTEEEKKTYAQQLTGGLLASAAPRSVWTFLLIANLFFKWNFVLLSPHQLLPPDR